MKWKPFFKIRDGSYRHREFQQQCISDIIDVFHIEVRPFSLILVAIGQILKKWQ